MKSPVAKVRCYGCGRVQRRDSSCCARCGATFDALCMCGAAMSVYDDECPACHAPHAPNRVPTSKLPWVRAAKWTAIVLVLAVLGEVARRKYLEVDRPAWKLKAETMSALRARDLDAAALLAREYTEQNQSDADGWYLLAVCYRELEFPVDTYRDIAEKALVCNSDHAETREFLARAEMELGHLDRAIEHAAAATRVPSPKSGAWLLLARLEQRRSPPNLLVIKEALDRAAESGRETDELKLLRAGVEMQLLGGIGGGPDRMPTQVAASLRTALAVLEAQSPGDVANLSDRARILIALGEADKAYSAASAALSQFPAGSPPEATADVRMLGAMALHARGNRDEAKAEFARVLFDRPDSATAGAASEFLSSADDALSARALLAVAAEKNDPKGAVRAVLATLLLDQGELDLASEAIEAARRASPSDPALAEILGTVRAAQFRIDEAREAYGDAIGLAPNRIGPRVRLALLPLSGRPDGAADAARCAQAVRDMEELRTRFGDDPFLLEGLGRLRLASGDAKGAVTALETASRRSPSNPDVWLALAAARRASGADAALDDAATALARARRLRPTSSQIALAEAETWLAAGRPDVAVATCTEFLRRRPDDAGALRLRARAYRELGMWSVVAADLRRVHDLGLADERDEIDRVDALHRAGDKTSARALTESLAATATPAGLRLLGVISALNDGDAEVAMQRLREYGPSLLLAEIQLGSGRSEDAVVTLRALWTARPGDPSTARLLVATLLGPVPVPPERIEEARAVAADVAPETPPGFRELLEGRILLAQGRTADSVAPLRVATRALPTDPLAWLFFAESVFASGDRAESLAAFRKASAFPGAHQAAIAQIAAARLFTASTQTSDVERAEELALEALRLDPRLVGAAFRTAKLLHARGEHVRAAEILEGELKLPGISPGDVVSLRLAAAQERLWAGDFTLAELHVDALAADVRDRPVARLVRAFAASGAGRFDEAVRACDAILATDPSNPTAVYVRFHASLRRAGTGVALAVARVEAWCDEHPDERRLPLAAARLLAEKGFPNEAIRLAQRCAERHPDDLAVAVHLAATLKKAGRKEEAVLSLRRFASAAKGDAADPSRLIEATMAVRCGIDLEPALAAARGLASSPGASPALRREAEVLVAEALLALGRAEEAERDAKGVLARLAESAVGGPSERALESRANFVVGFVAAAANPPRRAEAQEAYLRCTDLDRDNLDAANNLAFVMSHDVSTAPRALQLSRRIVAEAPLDPGYWDTLAEAARRSGEYSEAESAWTRSLALLADARDAAARRRGRIALRYAEFLRDLKKDDRAREIASGARTGITGTEEDRALERFLSQGP